MEEFDFVPDDEIQSNRRFQLLQLRDEEVQEFRNYKLVPVFDREIPRDTFTVCTGPHSYFIFKTDVGRFNFEWKFISMLVSLVLNLIKLF